MAVTSISESLFQALSKIDRPGSFCAEGSMPVVLPGLVVDGVGLIGFPLTAQQAKEIKKHCEQAPYGKGEQTVVDTEVRRVRHMTPDRFQLTNSEWPNCLAEMVKLAQQELGLEKQKLEAHLYDLLLYEEGSFFLPHRDGEKQERMVATLVVVLPSTYEGGDLVARHEGQEQTMTFGSAVERSFYIHFAAFYADCEHEVRPLREGYRLCLIYNLTLVKGRKAIAAPRAMEHIAAVRDILRAWQADAAADSPRKLAVTLEHQYTQDGLGWDTLKGVDRARAQVLREAACQVDCKANLALLTFWESGSAVDDGSADYYGRRRWHREYDNDEHASGNHEMEEVFDSSLTAEHWTDAEGNRLKLGKMTVEPNEVVPEESLRDVEPEEDYEGYTGNAGMTLERWYRHGAILVWPGKRHFEVLCGSSTENPVAALGLLVRQWQKAGRNQQTALREQCLEFARYLMANWHPSPRHSGQEAEPCELAWALAQLNEPSLIQHFLAQVMTVDSSVEFTPALLKVCEKQGWPAFEEAFEGLFLKSTAESLPRNVRLLEQLCAGKWKKNAAWATLCGMLAQETISALEAVDRGKDDWRTYRLNRLETLASLIRSLAASGQTETLDRLRAYISAATERYPLREVQIQALIGLGPWLAKHLDGPCPSLSAWLASCRQKLESLTAEKPVPPADFRRDAEISCRCDDCQELALFLQDPQEKVHRFAVRKDRRQHLHQIIDQDKCDVEHVTERRGSPQTLVCTKNMASFHRRLQQYEVDKEHLKTLRSMETILPG